jgi:hypothetical protein
MVLIALASIPGGGQVAWWAQFSAAVNAAWSKHMGYAFLVVDEHHPSIVQQGTDVDVRFAKVRAPSGITHAPTVCKADQWEPAGQLTSPYQ